MNEGPTLPKDLQVEMALIHAEHLAQENEMIRKMLALHETELAVLWCSVCIIGGTLIWSIAREDKKWKIASY